MFPESTPSIRAGILVAIAEAAPRLGVSRRQLFAGLSIDEDDVAGPAAFLSWLDLATALDNLREAGLSLESIEELGRAIAPTPHLLLQRIAGMFVRPEHLLYAVIRWVGPAAFPALEATLDDRGRAMRLVLALPEGYRDSLPYFYLAKGLLANAPTLMGCPPAVIRAILAPSRGTYDIQVADRDPPRRATQMLRSLRPRTSAMKTLAGQESELRDGLLTLARSQQQFRDMIDALPDAILVHGDGATLYANPVLPRLLGHRDAHELVGQPWTALVAEDDRELAETVGAGELRFVRKDGSTVLLELLQPRPILFEGRPATLLVGRDVTRRRELQNRQAVADKMASLGTLAAGIAHEINNPLQLVLTTIDLAERAAVDGDADTVLARLRAAADGARRVRDIVQDLRLFSRADGDAPRRELVDLGEVVRSTVELAQGEAASRATLTAQLAPIPPVLAHRGHLGQVLLNLIVNALSALPERAPEDNRVTVRAARDGDEVVLEVEDNGVGIPPAIQPRLFEPFFSTKTDDGGGLGLAVAETLVRRHGGAISFRSEVDRGTCFRVVLPTATSSERRANAPPPQPDVSATRTGRVLVVDDEPILAEVVAGSLADAAHEVTTAASGREAIEAIEQGDGFDAIVCDLVMRDGSGVDVHAYLTETRPELAARMVFMTGGLYRPEHRDFVARLPNRCLQKPFAIEELLEAIDAILALE